MHKTKPAVNRETILAYITTRKRAAARDEINKTFKRNKNLVRAIEKYCDDRNGKISISKRLNIKEIDFGFIAEYWPYEKMITLDLER